MSENVAIKTRVIGGFDKKQVDEYLDMLRKGCEQSAGTDEYNELNAELNRLRAELNEKDAQISSLSERLDRLDFEQTASTDASQLDALAGSTEKFALAHGEVIKIAEETDSYIKSTDEKLPSLFEKLSSLSDKINVIHRELELISAEFDEVCPSAPNENAVNDPEAETESFFDIFAEHEDELNEKLNSLNPQK